MQAIQFIKDHGVEKAREVVKGAHSWADVFLVPTGEYCSICISPDDADEFVSIDDLKRLVENIDLIKFYGGIERAKLLLAMGTCLADRPPHAREVQLKQAIADYESIYGGEHV